LSEVKLIILYVSVNTLFVGIFLGNLIPFLVKFS